MRTIARKTLERILDLRDKLRDLDARATEEIVTLEKTLAELQLGVPIRFGEYFTWARRAGRWALWQNASLETEQPLDYSSMPRAYRAEFLEWLGDAFGETVVTELEEAFARRRAALAAAGAESPFPVIFHKGGLPKTESSFRPALHINEQDAPRVYQMCGKSMPAGLTCTEEQGHPAGECRNWKSDAEKS